jgi:hypothetical protein
MKVSIDKIPLGISEDDVVLGSHLIHFWHTDEEFERGIRFLEVGIPFETQYCVLFGHDEANHRVLEILRRKGHEVDRMLQEGRLVILRRESSASATLVNIEEAFSAAMRKGATAIRYLGNLGAGKAPLPGRGAGEVIRSRKWSHAPRTSLSLCDCLHVRRKHRVGESSTQRRFWYAFSCCFQRCDS